MINADDDWISLLEDLETINNADDDWISLLKDLEKINDEDKEFSQQTMRTIHCAILKSDSQREAGKKLGVSSERLGRRLAKTTYKKSGKTKPLTYQAMKDEWRDEVSALSYWGSAYDEKMNSDLVDLNQKTMCDIHHAILESDSLRKAAEQLGVCDETLSNHLAQISYQTKSGENKPLTYQAMKNRWPSTASALSYWRNAYDQLSGNLKKIKTHCCSRAASPSMRGIFSNQHPRSTIDEDKEFSQRLNRSHITLLKMRDIHRVILKSDSLCEAARKLGVVPRTLSNHLAKTTYKKSGETEPLTYQAMKDEWQNADSALSYWGSAYDEKMNSALVDLNQKSMRDIHHAVLKSNSLRKAAEKLGVAPKTLSNHLAQISYQTKSDESKPLTYQAMKDEWLNEVSALSYWGNAYDQPSGNAKSRKRKDYSDNTPSSASNKQLKVNKISTSPCRTTSSDVNRMFSSNAKHANSTTDNDDRNLLDNK